MSAEHLHWYSSKIDWWIVPILCLPPAAAVAVCIAAALGGSTAGLLVGVATAVLVVGIYLGLIFPMRYGLNDTHLVVRSGSCRQRISLADISEVYPTSNPLSAPALSLDRLHVQFGKGVFKAVRISPADRDHFLDELARRAGLKREGERLLRVYPVPANSLSRQSVTEAGSWCALSRRRNGGRLKRGFPRAP